MKPLQGIIYGAVAPCNHDAIRGVALRFSDKSFGVPGFGCVQQLNCGALRVQPFKHPVQKTLFAPGCCVRVADDPQS